MPSSEMYAVPPPPSYYSYYRPPYTQPADVYPTVEECWSDTSAMLPLLAFGNTHPSPFVSLPPLGEPTYETSNPVFPLHNNFLSRSGEDLTGLLQNTSLEAPVAAEPFQASHSTVGPSSVGCALAESLATLHNDTDVIPTNSFINPVYNPEIPDFSYSSQNLSAPPHNELLMNDVYSNDDFQLTTMQPTQVNQRLRNKDHIETSCDSTSLTSERVPSVSDYNVRNPEFSGTVFENAGGNEHQYFPLKTECSDTFESRTGFSDCLVPSLRKFDYRNSRTPDTAYNSIPQQNPAHRLPFLNDDLHYKPKKGSKSISDDDSINKDEKRAKELNLPISIEDIINLAIDEYNERLSKYELTDQQLNLIRDIRRRGKNKVAAQNCRKRKMDQIHCLQQDLDVLQSEKMQLKTKQEFLVQEKQHIEERYIQLHRIVSEFTNCKVPSGLSSTFPVQNSDLMTLPTTSAVFMPDDNSDLSRAARTKRKLKK